MHISSRLTCAVAAVVCLLSTAHPTTAPGKPFELTVDSIMRGPKLVGYPQTGLRWSGDSSRLYFEWRRPGDDEAATYVVNRDGPGSDIPRKLTEEERKSAPPPNGAGVAWDKAHRRVLFVDQGDIVLIDSVANTRRPITRMTGTEANPRWARRESAVTFTRDSNLFIVPLDPASAGGPGGPGGIIQLTDIQPKKRDARETESQETSWADEYKRILHVFEEHLKGPGSPGSHVARRAS